MSTLRAIACVLGVICATTALGNYYGLRVGTNGNLIRMAPLNTHVSRALEVTRALDQRFMESITWDQALYRGSIPAMLATLDPHSAFLEPDDFRKMREQERGSYAGVGMQIISFGKKTIVDYPLPGTPAFNAGVLPGDAIELVDGQRVAGLNLEQVAGHVKGPPGTSVHLSLAREGSEELIELDLVRNIIPQPTVPIELLFEDNTGYVRLSSFGERTPAELDKAIEGLETQGLEGLVLDLRDNKGGLLSAGVRVASRFLPKGERVVSHRGRASEERHHRALEDGPTPDYPVVVLVNCTSASASEIVAGALQDHDRALIAGTNTFGKGLVQSVFSLPESTGMVLTTARYYSPSGRLIQRPYDNRSAGDYFREPCSAQYRQKQGAVRLTAQGRKVYELGGIAPDVRIEEPRANRFQQWVARERAVERFVARARSLGFTMLRGEAPAPEMLEALLLYLQLLRIPTKPASEPENRQFLMQSLATNLHTSYFGYDEGMRVAAAYDPVVLRARALLDQAAHLMLGTPAAVTRSTAPAPEATAASGA